MKPSVQTLQAVQGFAVGAGLSYILWWLAGALTGAGHGVYGLVSLGCAPFGYFYYAWPVITAGAFSQAKYLVAVSGVGLAVHYTWLLGHPGVFSRLVVDYDRLDSGGRRVLLAGVAVYVCLNLVNLIAIGMWLRAARRRGNKESP